jgi:transcriptional regulator with XRE-family HTH domain
MAELSEGLVVQIDPKRLMSLRIAKYLSQRDLSKLSGVSTAQIWSWETAKTRPTIGKLRKVAAALGCQVEDLILEVTSNE